MAFKFQYNARFKNKFVSCKPIFYQYVNVSTCNSVSSELFAAIGT